MSKMSINSGILKKMSIYFIGTLSTKFLSIILVPIYAYFVSAYDLGEYDYIVALSSIIFPIMYFVIWEAILRFCISEDNDIYKEEIFSTIILFTIAMTICSIVVCIPLFYINENNTANWYILFFAISQGLVSLWQFSARALGETKQYVIASVCGSISILLIELIYICFGNLDFIGLCIANIIAQIIVIVVLEQKIHLIKFVKIKNFKLNILIMTMRFTIPLVINNVSLYLYNSGSKMIIKNNIGSYENGLYSFASKFSLLISLFSMVVSMAVIEEAYSFKSIIEYKNRISVLIFKISKAYLSLIMLALPFLYILYSVAFKNTEYYPSVDYIFLLLLGALFTALSNNFGSAFQITDKTKYISLTTILGACLAIGISMVTVNQCGVLGVLIGGAVGPFVMMLSRAIFAKKTTGLSISWKLIGLLFIFSVFEYIILVCFKNILVQVIVFIFSFILIMFINKNDVRLLIAQLVKRGN